MITDIDNVEDCKEEILVVERCLISTADRMLSAHHFLQQSIEEKNDKLIKRCTIISDDYQNTILRYSERIRKLQERIQELTKENNNGI